MMRYTMILLTVMLSALLAAGAHAERNSDNGYRWVPVSGTGTHYFTTAIIHSKEPTPTGLIQRSTDIVELEGDLEGRVLYHPVSEFDYAAGTLVNTGHQVFSGTVLGSGPVLLFDDEFRFDVNLSTGETTGKIFLNQTLAGPRIRCELTVEGTGSTAGGDATIGYTGECMVKRAKRVNRARR